MMLLPKSLLALSAAAVSLTWPSKTSIVGAVEVPTPTFEVNFSDPSSVAANTLDVTATVLTGPGGVDALRIDECGKRATLPINVNPSVMPELTMVLGINLVSFATDESGYASLGWALSSDDGGYDRSIAMHDNRFYGMGMPSGDYWPVWENEEQGKAPLNEWLHVVAVYSQTDSYGKFYVNGQVAPVEVFVNNNEGRSDLTVGTNLLNECNHWTDSWIKEVKIYDSALSSDDVIALNTVFQEAVGGEVADDIVDSSSDEEESESSDLLEDLIDLVTGSSAHNVVANGMTMIALVGTLFGLLLLD